MNKIKYSLLIALLMFGCSSEVDYMQIQAGDTIEVTSETFPGNNEGIVYAWGVPKSDDGDIPSFRIENNSMHFKANKAGKYYLSLSLETNGGEIIAKEEFYYDAIQAEDEAIADNPDLQENIEKIETTFSKKYFPKNNFKNKKFNKKYSKKNKFNKNFINKNKNHAPSNDLKKIPNS